MQNSHVLGGLLHSFFHLLSNTVTSAHVLEGEICSGKLQGRHGFFQYLD